MLSPDAAQEFADALADTTDKFYQAISGKGFNPEACLEILLAVTPAIAYTLLNNEVQPNTEVQSGWDGLNGPGFSSAIEQRRRRNRGQV